MIKKLHILLVEDDWLTRRALSDYLIGKGYDVFEAGNGLEGLRILEQSAIDLVISDYSMPRMGGKELILNIKKIHPRLPVILSSGLEFNEKEDFQQIKEFLYDFLRKPINLGLLQKVIQKVQRKTFYV